ncbi:conjugative transposon protein TraM [Bacteroides thetaiotaomicron]|nr:conjugative transposon protein TraM [Bacteroides thetaiotaomicron]
MLEPLQVGGVLVPANTPLYGTVRIEGQRMAVTVNSIESGGNILPVELTAYDMDGQAGLFVPNTAERTAMKEAAANIGGQFRNKHLVRTQCLATTRHGRDKGRT